MPTPPRASVIVAVTEVIDIDRPDSIIIDHVQLIVPVLPRRSTSSHRHNTSSYRNETASRADTWGKVIRPRMIGTLLESTANAAAGLHAPAQRSPLGRSAQPPGADCTAP